MADDGKIGLFDWLNALNSSKTELMVDEASEKSFDPFIIRRGVAQNMDTVLLAQEMNKLHALPKRMVHDFFMKAITRKKRYGKWAKKEVVDSGITVISAYYKVSIREATEYAKLMTPEQIKELEGRMDQGGRKGEKSGK